MNLVRRIAREIVFPAVVTLNLEKLFSFTTDHNKLILVYHGVVEKPDHKISVGPIPVKQFVEHLAYFKRNYDVVSLETIFQMYRDDFHPKKKTIAITFDDGYENNYTLALPILKKFGFPATMYIISQCIEDDERLTWYDYVDIIKSGLDATKIDTTSLNRQPLKSISELKSYIKALNIQQRNILFSEIRKLVNLKDYIGRYPQQNWKLLNKRQIQELADSGLVEIGAHTHNHPNLGEIKIEDARQEILQCKQMLENLTQKQVQSLAFPDGSYTDEVKKICLQAEYRNLLAVDYRCASDLEDKNILPRYCISSTTTFESNIIAVNRRFKQFGF